MTAVTDELVPTSRDPWLMPEDPWNQVAPGLWVGHGDDFSGPVPFSSVLTLDESLPPAHPLLERRHPAWLGRDLPGPITLLNLRDWAYAHWTGMGPTGVLIRDFTGLNRSSLVAALVMRKAQIPLEQVYAALREQRHPLALTNPRYRAFLEAQR